MTRRTRFAPSPTGPLHLGHAYAAKVAHDLAHAAGGTFLIRIEDIDQSRARAVWETAIFDDLTWLGLSWHDPVLRQSDRTELYRAALEQLWREGLLYPCSCNRRDIAAAVAAQQEGDPPMGPDGIIYPGTCRKARRDGPLPQDALRLDLTRASERVPRLTYTERGLEPGDRHIDTRQLLETTGDIVVARRDMGTSYHLSVVVDDAAQEITHVTRGVDLEPATPIHVLLQRLLGLPTPVYHHHRLIRDDAGKRLAKRDDARAISRYRDDGESPDDIWQRIAC